MQPLPRVNGVPEEALANYNPDRYDAIPNPDGTFDLIPLLWWNESSYAEYQGDYCYEGDE